MLTNCNALYLFHWACFLSCAFNLILLQNSFDLSWSLQDDEMMTAVIKIQCIYRSKIARGEITVKKAAVLKEAKETKWYACDDGEGNIYYYSTETGECVWEKPDDFDGEDKTPPAVLNTMMKKAFEGKLKKLDSETHKALKKAKEAQAKAEAARDAGVNNGLDIV